MKQQKYIWMKVSQDRYRLPEVIASSAAELARKCGVTKSAVYNNKCYVRIPDTEEEEETSQ